MKLEKEHEIRDSVKLETVRNWRQSVKLETEHEIRDSAKLETVRSWRQCEIGERARN